jgi:hypothetical protein
MMVDLLQVFAFDIHTSGEKLTRSFPIRALVF